MEKEITVPENQKFLASVIEEVAQGFQVRLIREGKPVAMVVPFKESEAIPSANFLDAYNRFRRKFDFDHLDIDFEKEVKAGRYRQKTLGRKVDW